MSKFQFTALLSSILVGFASVCFTLYWVRPISDEVRQARENRAKDNIILQEFRDFMSGKIPWKEISDDLFANLSDEDLLGPSSVPVYESVRKMQDLGIYLNFFAEDNDGIYPKSEDELLKAFPAAKDFVIDGWGEPIRWFIKPDELDEPYMSSFITCSRPTQRKKYNLDLMLIGIPCPQRKTLIWQPPLGTFVVDCEYGSALPMANKINLKAIRDEQAARDAP